MDTIHSREINLQIKDIPSLSKYPAYMDSPIIRDLMYVPTKIFYKEVENNMPTKLVIFKDGSGASGFKEDVLMESIVNKGYAFLSVMEVKLDSKERSYPYVGMQGYAFTPSDFIGSRTKGAWQVKAALSTIDIDSTFDEVVLLGQSRGASNILAYLGGLAGQEFSTKLKGVFLNSPAFGGYGGKRWENLPHTIRTMGNLYNWAAYNPVRKVIHYGRNDDYFTPEMLKSMSTMLYNNDPNLEMLYSNKPHGWMSKYKENADYVADQIYNIFNDLPVHAPKNDI